MSYQVTLSPSQRRFSVDPDERLLEAGLTQGVGLPYGCRSGVCGACKAKVLEGDLVHLDPSEHALSANDRAQGLALLCCSTANSDLRIEIREVQGSRDFPVRIMPARVQAMQIAAADVMIVRLKLPANENFRYRPGQYVDVLLKDGQRRSFSIANGDPSDEGIELHIRRVPGGRFTEQVFTTMKPRDILRLEGPLGSFFLEEGKAPVILLAGGTGFAPVKAIVEAAIAAGAERSMHLYWGAGHQSGLYQHELVERWAAQHPWFGYTPVLSGSADPDWQGRRGLVHRALMDDHADLSAYQVYACGSPAMIAAARADLIRERSLPEGAFFSDAFTFANFPS